MPTSKRITALEFLKQASIEPDARLEGPDLERVFWAYRGLALEIARERAFWSSTNQALANAFKELADKSAEVKRVTDELERLDRSRAQAPLRPVAESAEMKSTLHLARAVAIRPTTVLLLGETGTGKGMLARFIHEETSRASRRFVELNCAGLQPELTDAELFGYERGAFTGAAGRKLGLFEAADGGTLFLDEIGEMDTTVQAKLLKVLDERRFRRVGGLHEIEVDVRVIVATHRDLSEDVARGRFRSDLFFRLNVFAIEVPPLRQRREDIAPLARSFLREHRASPSSFTPRAERLLLDYDWPGNVRELRNVVERAAILCPLGEPIDRSHLPPLKAGIVERQAAATTPLGDVERQALDSALKARGGNILATARAMGISRGTLYRKIRKYGLSADD